MECIESIALFTLTIVAGLFLMNKVEQKSLGLIYKLGSWLAILVGITGIVMCLFCCFNCNGGSCESKCEGKKSENCSAKKACEKDCKKACCDKTAVAEVVDSASAH